MSRTENFNRGKKSMLFNNFLGGVAWGIGVGVGTTFFATFIIYLLSKIDFIPLVGNFVANVMKYTAQSPL